MSAKGNTAAQATPRQRAPLPPSPCIGICTVDDAHGFCNGCGRTPQEIAQWPASSQEQKSTVWRDLPVRLGKLGLRVFRLPATPEQIAAFLEQSLLAKAGTWEVGIPAQPLRFNAASAKNVVCAPSCVTAENTNGCTIQLIKHDRVRAFGLVDEHNADRLSAVAMALPCGRAEMQRPAVPTDMSALAIRYPYARFTLHRLADGADRLRAETMIADIDLTVSGQDIAALQGFQFDQAAPGPFGIPRAFAVGAVFRAHDQNWLTRAMMP